MSSVDPKKTKSDLISVLGQLINDIKKVHEIDFFNCDVEKETKIYPSDTICFELKPTGWVILDLRVRYRV